MGGVQAGRWLLDFRVFFLAVLYCPSLGAQTIIAPAGRTLFNGSSLVRSYTEIDRFSLDTDGNSVRGTQYINPVAFVYGFYPKWTAIAVQPYVVTDVTTRMDNQTKQQGINGLADVQFFVQYDGLYSRNTPGGLTRVSGIFGVQAPTGAQRFSTGAFEYNGGLIFEKAVRLKYYFTGDFQYTFSTSNGKGLSIGNTARFDAAPAYFLIPRGDVSPDASWFRKAYSRVFSNGTFFILELNGIWHAQATTHGSDIANSGGTTLMMSPGVQYFASRSFLVEFSVPIPVVNEFNGVQPKPKTSFFVGFRYLF
jgi:hypothetical protein